VNSGMMEQWEEYVFCFLVILHSAIRNLHSAIEAGKWSDVMDPQNGEKVKSDELRVMSHELEKT
jgi:hypothetical protein